MQRTEKSNQIYLEYKLRKAINHTVLQYINKTNDENLKSFLEKLKMVSALHLTISDSNEKNDIDWRSNKAECSFCKVLFGATFDLVIHWIFHHREHSFRLEFKETTNSTYIIGGICKKKKNLSDDRFNISKQIFSRNRIEVYQKIKNSLQKAFYREEITGNLYKKEFGKKLLIENETDDENHLVDDLKRFEIKNKLKDKTFYHSKDMFKVVNENSLFEESEDEVEEEFILQAEKDAIDAYDDIEIEDKEFFKIWNTFLFEEEKSVINKKNLITVSQKEFGKKVFKFVKNYKEILIEKKLRNSFVMHLATLNIYGLISKDEILLNLLEYDK